MSTVKTTKKSTSKVTKSDLIDAFDDILTIFDFNDLPDTETATIKELVAFIEEKQDTDDCFNDEDFEVVDGKATALSIDTVATLIKAGVTVPETWAEKLASVVTKKTAKKVKKIKEEEEYEEALKEAENETTEDTFADIDKLEEITKEEEEEEEEEKPAKKSSKKPVVEDDDDNEEEEKKITKKKNSKGKNFLGHLLSSENNTLDQTMLNFKDGFTLQDMEKLGYSKNRIHNHIYHLMKQKSDLVDVIKTKNESGTIWKVVKK